MRVLLINPFYPISETPSPPLGLAYLAAALEAACVRVRILDYVVHPFDRSFLEDVLDEFDPHLVGATSVTMTVDGALGILKTVKEMRPEIPTVMGGPHVTFAARETLQAHAELDLVVIGEGERTLVDLVRSVVNRTDPAAVPGIAFRQAGQIRFSPPRPFITDLESLPAPARHYLSLGRYRALRMPISMTTSRGCPFKCIFCAGRRMVGAKVRYRNPTSVVDELETLAGMGFHQINLADDLFTANKAHCLAVCDEIRDRRLEVEWTSFARVDTVSVELLARMRSAGCTAVSFGIESGDPAILKSIGKGITRKQVIAAVEMCSRAGVEPYASFILGLPGETEESIRKTMAFGDRLKKMGLKFGFHLLAPFPGTEVRDRHQALGIRILSDDWSEYHANRAVVETCGVSASRLNELIVDWEQKYNSHLAAIADRMAAGTASPQEAGQLIGLERVVMLYDLMMAGSIERHGCWRQKGRPPEKSEAVEQLTERLAAARRVDREKLADAVASAVDRDNLIMERQGDLVRWKWRDCL